MSRPLVLLLSTVIALGALSCTTEQAAPTESWTLTEEARQHVNDPVLEARIFQALDAAAAAGTDPSISKYDVRAGTVVQHEGADLAIVGGNSEYAGYPEAIHGETSLMNHVINLVGPEAAHDGVQFLAFHKAEQCGGGGSCGDCRDYLMTTTAWQDLLMVCGQESDHSVHVHRFAKWVVPENTFPEVAPEDIPIAPSRLEELVQAALEARSGGVSLFTAAEEHLGVAALSSTGVIYRAAGADDAAFHYRYPVGAALQQAATYRDYLVEAMVVVSAPGTIPRISYRDRQYGYEFSSFNGKRDLAPIRLILVEEELSEDGGPATRRYRMTTFEEALPGAFSAASFMPDAVEEFLSDRVR
jgi:hypothetical protein